MKTIELTEEQAKLVSEALGQVFADMPEGLRNSRLYTWGMQKGIEAKVGALMELARQVGE